MKNAPNTLRRIFERLGVEPPALLLETFGIAGELQRHRRSLRGEQRSGVGELTRSAFVYAAGISREELRAPLEEAGLFWPEFKERVGGDSFKPGSKTGGDPSTLVVDEFFADALAIVGEATGFPRSLGVEAVLWAIFEQARRYPNTGRLPETLGSGFDFGSALEAMQRALAGGWPKPEGDVAMRVHADAPALLDELNRRPFAEVLASRIRQLRREQDDSAAGDGAADTGAADKGAVPPRDQGFMAHLHGPWGSGKSSVLNFLAQALQGVGVGKQVDPKRAPEWVVVRFNAWQHQRVNPPWWALINEVYKQAKQQLAPAGEGGGLRRRWAWWRIRADLLPTLVWLAGIGLVALAAVLVFDLNRLKLTFESIAKLVGTVVSVVGALAVASRRLALGSALAAQKYRDLAADPMAPIIRLFDHLIRKGIKRPVAIFIDDLDRCEATYVVDLLEGIQTLFRDAPVAYVVAADRDWLMSSFEQRHKEFAERVGEPGRPLGYLFVEKMFQISAAVPGLASGPQRDYLERLVRAKRGVSPEALDRQRRERLDEARQLLGEELGHEEIQQVIADQQDPELADALRAVGAQVANTPRAREATEHRLLAFSELLEPNPRAMKRLVNAVGARQSLVYLERRRVHYDTLVLWTLLELRWPLLADLLAERAELVEHFAEGAAPPPDTRGVEPLRSLFAHPAVRAVINGRGGHALTAERIRRLVGDGGGDAG